MNASSDRLHSKHIRIYNTNNSLSKGIGLGILEAKPGETD
jgi:hypothetical protein